MNPKNELNISKQDIQTVKILRTASTYLNVIIAWGPYKLYYRGYSLVSW